jgi:predicted permease
MAEELRFHLELCAEENVARGMTRAEALNAARRQLGNITLLKDQWRDLRGGGAFEVFWRDLVFASRMLLKDRALTVTAVVALALGIGANTALFTIIRSALLRPLPYAAPEQLVRIWSSDSGRPAARSKSSYPDFLDLQSRNQTLASLGAFAPGTFIINNNRGELAQVEGVFVTSDIFPMLGARAALGRIFSPDDDKAGRRTAVISEQLWEERFARAANVTDASLTIDGERYAIVGVMPPAFQFPVQNRPAQVWITFSSNQEPAPGYPDGYTTPRDGRFLHLLGRLKEDGSSLEAQAEMNRLAADLASTYPETNVHYDRCIVRPWLADLTSHVRPALVLLVAAAGCLLFVACANIANLLLARAARRQKEIAIRVALGAGRRRILRQLLTESLLLAVLGGAAGLLLAFAATALLVPLLPADFPRVAEIAPDGWVLAFTACVTLVTTALLVSRPRGVARELMSLPSSRAAVQARRTAARADCATGSRSPKWSSR